MTNIKRVHSSVVEHLTADQEVTGSNPVGPFFAATSSIEGD